MFWPTGYITQCLPFLAEVCLTKCSEAVYWTLVQ